MNMYGESRRYELDYKPERLDWNEYFIRFMETGDIKYYMEFLHYYEPVLDRKTKRFIERYELDDYRAEDLKQILTSVPSEKYPVTLGSSENDNVLFFWSGHGTKKGWSWKETEDVSPEFAREMFSAMKFRKQFAIIETCYSGVVGEGCTGIPGLLMMTAANPYEPSKAYEFDDEIGVDLSNTFTASILSHLEENPQSVIRDLYLHAFDKTNGSHVMVYNSDWYGSLYLNDMREYWPNF